MRTAATLLVLVLALPVLAGEDDDPIAAARALLRTPRHEEGVAALRDVIREYRKGEPDATKLVYVGQAHYLLDEDEAAVKALEEAVTLEPENAWAHTWLGIAWRWVDPAKAIAPLREALRLDPESDSAWFNLAKVLRLEGQNAEALEAILKALESGADHASAHFNAGLLLIRAGRVEEGVKHYEKAAVLDPTHGSARYNLGLAYFKAGRHEKALVVWQEAAALDATDLHAHAKVMKALTALGRHEEAVTWREKVYAIYDASEDAEVKKLRTFGFDAFEVGDLKVRVREVLQRGEDQLYATIFYVEGPDDVKFRVNLEPHAMHGWLGAPKYVLGGNEGPVHRTYDIDWKERPSYPELKQAVLRVIRNEVATRSSSNAEKGTVELK